MINYFKEILLGLRTLVTGMRITFVRMFHHRVTLDYPHKTVTMTPRYRGHVVLKVAENGQPKCIVCMACQRACPSGCIKLDGEKREGAARKSLSSYTLNFTTCSLCGLCVESCAFDALAFSKRYNLASLHKEEYLAIDLLQQAGGVK